MTDQPIDFVHEELPAVPPKPRTALYAILGVALVALVVVGAFVAVALVRNDALGPRMASAAAMPQDMQIYIDVDFTSLDRLDQMTAAFDPVFADAGVDGDMDRIIDQIDAELRTQFGMGVDDVTPWVARDVGIGISGLDQMLDDSSDGAVLPDILMAVSVRDTAGADAFVDEMVRTLEVEGFTTFSESTYQGVRLLASDEAAGGIVVARSADLMLMGSNEAVVQDAIDAQNGESLADDATMQETMDLLPADRAGTMYISGTLLDDLLGAFGGTGAFPVGDLEAVADNAVRSLAMSLALTDDGVRFDFVGLTDEDASGVAGVTDGLAASSKLPEQLPADTFVFLGIDSGQPADEPFDLDGAFAQLGPDEREELDAVIEQFQAEIGLDLQADLIGLLRGDFALGLFDSSAPIFGLPDGPQIGFTGLIGTTDPAAMQNTLDTLADYVALQGLPIEPRNFGDGSGYAFSDGNSDLAVLGVAGDYLVAASDASGLEVAAGGGPSLADDEFFQRADKALGSADPVLFVDLQQALRAFDAPPDVLRDFAAVEGMVAGGEGLPNGFRFTLVTLIDY